jgi:ribosomal protein S18 acetylase RimI-like enzyme
MTLLIREFEESDRADMISLWERCLLTRPWNNPSTDIDLALRTEDATVFVGTLKGPIVAAMMVGFDGHRGWVYYLGVDPAYRGRGYGRRMMVHAEDWLKAKGSPKIQLMVRDDNQAAIGFYEALSYAPQKVIVLGRRLDGDG